MNTFSLLRSLGQAINTGDLPAAHRLHLERVRQGITLSGFGSNNDLIGKYGELVVCCWLESIGYTITHVAPPGPFGEYDITADRGGQVVSVEVKCDFGQHPNLFIPTGYRGEPHGIYKPDATATHYAHLRPLQERLYIISRPLIQNRVGKLARLHPSRVWRPPPGSYRNTGYLHPEAQWSQISTNPRTVVDLAGLLHGTD